MNTSAYYYHVGLFRIISTVMVSFFFCKKRLLSTQAVLTREANFYIIARRNLGMSQQFVVFVSLNMPVG